MFHFRCPHCNAKLEAEDDWAGMEAACPKCSQTITIVPETTPEKPKIQLTPITVPSSADTQRPISQPLSQPAPSSTSNKFPFICPSCGILTDLDSSLQNQEYECPACCEKSIAVPATEKPCPHCGEMIKFQAKICRFCKKSVSEIEKRMPRQGEGVSIPSLIPATPIQLSIKELDTLFFWWWLSLALAIPTFGIGAVASIVFFCMLLYRYWNLIPRDQTSMTSGKAVGFLFIPFFGLYWSFESVWGLGKQFQSLTNYGKGKLESMSLVFCICGAVSAGALLFAGIFGGSVIGIFFGGIYWLATIGGTVFFILTMIHFQAVARMLIQRR